VNVEKNSLAERPAVGPPAIRLGRHRGATRVLRWIQPLQQIAVTLAILACALVAPVAGRAGAPLTILASSPSLTLGGVVLLTVRTPAPISALGGVAFGRPVRFWPSENALEWQGFVAADLEIKAGTYTVDLTATDAAGGQTTGKKMVTVRARAFETRRLRVGSAFVDPPATEGERIGSEATRLANLFTQTTPRAWRGAFQLPVAGTATSSFGRLTLLNGKPRGRHQGADFRAATGTPIHAPNAGRVVMAEDLYFSGNTVVIDHGLGMFSLLAHLSRLDVSVGDELGRGDAVGLSGATGRVTGPHLHWALRLSELSVDPLSVVSVLADRHESPLSVVAPR
jgi:murein DD-endopeptidase MepM/ murein hydrolase activator NlpD